VAEIPLKNLLTDHPSPLVRTAVEKLIFELKEWGQNTGRNNLIIIKESSGCQYRALDGDQVSHFVLLVQNSVCMLAPVSLDTKIT
jgi:hypothetical protein